MLEPGLCVICAKDIAPKCGECGTRKFGSQYTEVVMEWSNGSKMPVGVCLDCAKDNKHMTAHVKQQVTQDHHDYWEKQGQPRDKGIILV